MGNTLLYGATKVQGATAVSSLRQFHWKKRVLVIFADLSNAKASRQENLLMSEKGGLEERDLVVLRVASGAVAPLFGSCEGLNAEALRAGLEAPEVGVFAAILVGKDGSVKMRAVEPMTSAELFATIDRMPMRAAEAARDGAGQFQSSTTRKEERMSVPQEPNQQPPMPAPGWKPEPPIVEPEPDTLPDETPLPNPDETKEPPMHVR